MPGDFITCHGADVFFFSFLLRYPILRTYLSHSSTLNVGVVVEGVGELCLLTR